MSDLQCAARLVIARDGEAESDTPLLVDAGGGLSLTGRKQASALAESLVDARVSAIYCSGAARAVHTAEIVAARLGVVVRVRDRICEWSEGHDHAGLGEIVDLHRGETVLVVADGGSIGAAIPQLATNVPDNYGSEHEIGHCSVVEVDADADGWLVRSWAGEPVG